MTCFQTRCPPWLHPPRSTPPMRAPHMTQPTPGCATLLQLCYPIHGITHLSACTMASHIPIPPQWPEMCTPQNISSILAILLGFISHLPVTQLMLSRSIFRLCRPCVPWWWAIKRVYFSGTVSLPKLRYSTAPLGTAPLQRTLAFFSLLRSPSSLGSCPI